MGGVRATDVHAELLDILQAAGIGTVTDVLEAEDGFYIVYWRAPPAAETVSGQRLVIRYAGAINDEIYGASSRARSEAIELAARLRAGSETFSQLVTAHSETSDRLRFGDLGVWSTTDATFIGRELEALSELAVGQTSEPLDTPHGIALLHRTQPSARDRYAAFKAELRYDPSAPQSSEGSKAHAEQQARAMLAGARAQPSRYQDLAAEAGLELELAQWDRGQGDPFLERELSQAPLGGFILADTLWSFVVAQRVQPREAPPAVATFDLPAPNKADLDAIVLHSSPEALALSIEEMKADLIQADLFDEARRQLALDLLTTAQARFALAADGPARLEVKREVLAAMQEQLGSFEASKLEWFLNAWTAERKVRQTLGSSPPLKVAR